MKTNCFECVHLKKCLNGINEKDIQNISKTKIQLNFSKGELICKRGSPITHMYFLQSGFVKWHIDGGKNRKNIIFKVVKDGHTIGLPSVFDDRLHHFSTTAIEDSVVCMIDIHDFMDYFKKNPPFAEHVLNVLSTSANGLFDGMYSFATKNVNGRVADLLLLLYKTIYTSNKFVLTLSRQEMAEIISISKDNLIHTLSKFSKEGIINAKGKNIEILNIEKLLKISELG
ncbi:MAG: hypothetical protein C0594_10465 [Marinilabiliales bacterium]|nr:MAG: hypothetical protein C0594_10465 [Marinilabiliales bacterium]